MDYQGLLGGTSLSAKTRRFLSRDLNAKERVCLNRLLIEDAYPHDIERRPEVGEKVGISQLKRLIASAAAGLDQMGMPLNRSWREARDELLSIEGPHIDYEQFSAVCARRGLDLTSTKTLANLLHDLGYIVHWAEDEKLKNDVILKPEWLAKAIGFVLDDSATQKMDGVLPDSRLKDVWLNHPFKSEPRYGPELYPFFLRLMEKYDVCYRLETGDASLIAQHVSQIRPELPWYPGEKPFSGNRCIAMVVRMAEVPPGLVPWMIVRTHRFTSQLAGSYSSTQRRHWQRGMFLQNDPHGEAFLELKEGEFHVYVQAVWPEFFMNILRTTIRSLIEANWPGLGGRYSFNVPCQGKESDSECSGRFDIEALRQFLSEGDREIRCQVCRSRQDIIDLLYGNEGEPVREQLLRIEERIQQSSDKIQVEFRGLESRLANHFWAIMQAVASESKEGPRLFTFEPADGNWKRLFSKKFKLRLWCEAEGCQHPVLEPNQGLYEVDASREWIQRIAPYANIVAGILRTILPLAGPAINSFIGPKTIEELQIKDQLDLMKEATKEFLDHKLDVHKKPRLNEAVLTETERSGVLVLHALLRELDPEQQRMGLYRVPTYTGGYQWLCTQHFQNSQSRIPNKIA